MSHSMNTQGILHGVSLGPGDPDLITRRAWNLLHSDAILTHPVRKKDSASYALEIAQRAGVAGADHSIPLQFPMTNNEGLLAKYWLVAAQTVLDLLNTGRDVCFLVEGDASTYSTFSHLARTVQALDAVVRINIVPGISSYHAAAAHLQMPLADTDDAIAIIPAAYGLSVLEEMLDKVDTLVLLKVKPLLDDIIELLARRGILDQARFVEKVGSLDERTVIDVASLKNTKVNYLSLMLIRNPNRVHGELIRGCRKKPSMENSPV